MFAVFGMTSEIASKKAKIQIDSMANAETLSEIEYQIEINSRVEKLMSGDHSVKVSPEFSTPEIAERWVELAKNYDVRWLEICIYHPYKIVSKNGIRNVKYRWSYFTKGRNYQMVRN